VGPSARWFRRAVAAGQVSVGGVGCGCLSCRCRLQVCWRL
jgi:hypothetical protein